MQTTSHPPSCLPLSWPATSSHGRCAQQVTYSTLIIRHAQPETALTLLSHTQQAPTHPVTHSSTPRHTTLLLANNQTTENKPGERDGQQKTPRGAGLHELNSSPVFLANCHYYPSRPQRAAPWTFRRVQVQMAARAQAQTVLSWACDVLQHLIPTSNKQHNKCRACAGKTAVLPRLLKAQLGRPGRQHNSRHQRRAQHLLAQKQARQRASVHAATPAAAAPHQSHGRVHFCQ